MLLQERVVQHLTVHGLESKLMGRWLIDGVQVMTMSVMLQSPMSLGLEPLQMMARAAFLMDGIGAVERCLKEHGTLESLYMMVQASRHRQPSSLESTAQVQRFQVSPLAMVPIGRNLLKLP